ncbi:MULTISPECIES: hypothetical protein [Aerosakkonema]|uniref:hypothetical protein n=1 Tax=Aerosakkonema TaxID=1246629 RepID=UPI0035BA58C0
MNYDVKQWIEEINGLRQQVAQAQSDRDLAVDSAARWSQLFNTEAEQRRADAKLAQQTIDKLKAEIDQFKADFAAKLDEVADISASSPELQQLQSVEALKQKLVEVLLERDRLAEALKAEREAHAQTRQSLTTALGDTIDLLTKQRDSDRAEFNATPVKQDGPQPEKLPGSSHPAHLPSFKNPSLQLPPTRPAPPRL